MKSFRNEVFDVCNLLKNNPNTESIKKLVRSLNVYIEGQLFSDRSSFGYISRHSHNQFFGYLFTDEHIDLYKKDTLFQDISPLDSSERQLLEQGQATIDLFINESLQDIIKIYPQMGKVLNPYSKYKPIKPISADPFFSREQINSCVEAFKRTTPYQKLVNSKISDFLKSLPERQLLELCQVMERDILQQPYGIVSSDIKSMALRYTNNEVLPEVILFKDSCLMLSLREMLNIAAQLMFTAMVGADLIVLNNDNIIKIEKNESNIINKYMTVLLQDIPIYENIDIVGSIALIDCDPADNYHIHEFGFVKSETLSMNQDTGMTTKLSFSIINDDLNPIFNLTN